MDEIIIPPAVHSAIGGLTLLTALITTALLWRGKTTHRYGPAQRLWLVALQLALLLQIAVGIKLLDQNMGAMQKFIHYLGGLGALFLLMLPAWFPHKTEAVQVSRTAWLTTASLAFVTMTFFIGQFYVRKMLGA